MSGDEWKEGTPYEDPEDKAYRELRESLANLAESFKALGRSMEAMKDFGKPIAAEHAVTQLMALGVSEDEAGAAVRGCFVVAEAEGRNWASVLKAEIRRAAKELE